MMHLVAYVLGTLLLSGSMTLMADELSCDEAYTTLALNQCAKQDLALDEQQLTQTWLAVIARYKNDKLTVTALQKAQTQWQDYRTAHCQSIAALWRQGTIRGLMFLDCQRRLTQQREEELRTRFLIDR